MYLPLTDILSKQCGWENRIAQHTSPLEEGSREAAFTGHQCLVPVPSPDSCPSRGGVGEVPWPVLQLPVI